MHDEFGQWHPPIHERIRREDVHPTRRPWRVGNIIVTMRAVRGMSQSELARKAGISRRALSFIENRRQEHGIGVALRIAAALGEKVDVVFALHLDQRYRPR